MPLTSNTNVPYPALQNGTMPTGPLPAPPTANDPLAALKDIQLPTPIDWWPLAPGWWFLIFLGLVGLITGALYLHRHIKRNAYRRQALTQLQRLTNSTERDSLWLQTLNELLKRCAQSAYPQQNTAALHGKKWRAFLSQQASNIDTTPELLSLLSDGGYKSDAQITNELTTHSSALLHFSTQWINRHSKTIKQPAINTPC